MERGLVPHRKVQPQHVSKHRKQNLTGDNGGNRGRRRIGHKKAHKAQKFPPAEYAEHADGNMHDFNRS